MTYERILMYMIEQLESLLTPAVNAQDCELYDIEYIKEGGDMVLRLYIDKENGVDLDDCERVSHAVEAILDEKDPISTVYRLQVSSPGIERKLSKPAHYLSHIGRKIMVKLYAPVDPVSGRKKFTGTLIGFADNEIIITDEEKQSWTFNLKQVATCRLVIFD